MQFQPRQLPPRGGRLSQFLAQGGKFLAEIGQQRLFRGILHGSFISCGRRCCRSRSATIRSRVAVGIRVSQDAPAPGQTSGIAALDSGRPRRPFPRPSRPPTTMQDSVPRRFASRKAALCCAGRRSRLSIRRRERPIRRRNARLRRNSSSSVIRAGMVNVGIAGRAENPPSRRLSGQRRDDAGPYRTFHRSCRRRSSRAPP